MISQAYKQELDLLLKKAASCTCVIFYHDREAIFPTLKPSGTGVFFEANGNYFLITAGHVIFDGNNFNAGNFMISDNGKEMCPLSGVVSYNSEFDVGFIKLAEGMNKEFDKKFSFLTIGDILIDHENKDGIYFPFGFPTEMTWEDRKEKGHYRSDILSFWTKAENQLSKKLIKDYPSHSYILITYHPKELTFTQTGKQFPKYNPQGSSGGGLWWVDSTLPYSNKGLVGILIEYPDKKGKVMVAVRIEYITEALRQVYNCQFQKPSKIKIKVEVNRDNPIQENNNIVP